MTIRLPRRALRGLDCDLAGAGLAVPTRASPRRAAPAGHPAESVAEAPVSDQPLPVPPLPGLDADQGMTLRSAATFFASDRKMAEDFVFLALFMRSEEELRRSLGKSLPEKAEEALRRQIADLGITPERRAQFKGWSRWLESELKRRLAAGQLLARGFSAGSTQPHDISPDWWIGAKIDLQTSAAENHGVLLTGIIVWRAADGQRSGIGENPDAVSSGVTGGEAKPTQSRRTFKPSRPGRPAGEYREHLNRFMMRLAQTDGLQNRRHVKAEFKKWHALNQEKLGLDVLPDEDTLREAIKAFWPEGVDEI